MVGEEIRVLDFDSCNTPFFKINKKVFYLKINRILEK